jgi:tetratricopeptide (TPR) repeat protein
LTTKLLADAEGIRLDACASIGWDRKTDHYRCIRANAEGGRNCDIPSLALAHYGLALTLTLAGQLDEAISEYDTAMRLSSRDPLIWAFFSSRGWARLLLRDYEAAVEDARRAMRHPATVFYVHATLASALAHFGRREEAKNALDKFLEIKPDYSPDVFLTAYSPLNPEALRPLHKTYIDGLRKAGLGIPDEG